MVFVGCLLKFLKGVEMPRLSRHFIQQLAALLKDKLASSFQTTCLVHVRCQSFQSVVLDLTSTQHFFLASGSTFACNAPLLISRVILNGHL